MNDTHPFDLFWREKTKLDLLDRAQRRLGVRKVDSRHDDGRKFETQVRNGFSFFFFLFISFSSLNREVNITTDRKKLLRNSALLA